MTKITEEKFEDHETHVFFCDAADGDFVEVIWDRSDPEWRSLEVCSNHQPRDWKAKVKAVKNIVLGKPIWVEAVILNDQHLFALRDLFVALATEQQEALHTNSPQQEGVPPMSDHL